MAGIYISVGSGNGTISATNYENWWSTSRSALSGASGYSSSMQTTFEASPDRGYTFSYFAVYVDKWNDDCSNPRLYDTYTSNPLSLSAEGLNCVSYHVEAIFESSGSSVQTYSVRIQSWIDGGATLYDTYNLEVEYGDEIYVGSYVSYPNGYELQYVYYGTTYSYYPWLTVTGNMTIQVFFKESVVKPSSWTWSNVIASGYQIKITAADWNNFTARINEVRAYLGVTYYSFTTVSPGMSITATICNQAHNAIGSIYNYQSLYSMPSSLSDGGFPASFFTSLTNILNAIISYN